MKKFSKKNMSKATHLLRGSCKPLCPVPKSVLCPVTPHSTCYQCGCPGRLWPPYPGLEPWNSGLAECSLLTSSRASHLGHFPFSSRVSSDFPLQTCLGLGLKLPTQSAHHQRLWSLPSLDIWGTQRGCCPFPFLQHTGVFFKRQD